MLVVSNNSMLLVFVVFKVITLIINPCFAFSDLLIVC